jgi:hypothetical protein
MIEDIDTIQQQPLPNEEEVCAILILFLSSLSLSLFLFQNPIDLSQKLSTLGLTSEVGRHDTEGINGSTHLPLMIILTR